MRKKLISLEKIRRVDITPRNGSLIIRGLCILIAPDGSLSIEFDWIHSDSPAYQMCDEDRRNLEAVGLRLLGTAYTQLLERSLRGSGTTLEAMSVNDPVLPVLTMEKA